MKAFIVTLFYRQKFLGAISSLIAGYLVSLVASRIPLLPELVQIALAHIMDMPSGTAITPEILVAWLTPIIAGLISASVQEFVIRDHNRALEILSEIGVYDGKLDGWVGPDARGGINALIEALRNRKVE